MSLPETCILTMAGDPIDLAAPYDNAYSLQEAAWACSMICRFGGHVSRFYSVLQHSLFCAELAELFCGKRNSNAVLACLSHDLHEGYVLDVTAPMKVVVPEYKDRVERHVERAFQEVLDLHSVMDKFGDLVKLTDLTSRSIEDFVLRGKNRGNREGEKIVKEMKCSFGSLSEDMIVFKELSPGGEVFDLFMDRWHEIRETKKTIGV